MESRLPNQALLEWVPLGQADQMSVGAIYIASKVFVLNNLVNSMNSVRLVYIENYQRRSGAVRHGAEHNSVRRHLAPVR